MKNKLLNIILTPLAILALLLMVSCGKESPTVTNPDITSTGSGGSSAGYYYPSITAVYPADGTATAPVDTEFMVIFNIPVNNADLTGGISISSSSIGALTETTHYTISSAGASTTYARITFIYGGIYPLPDNETVTITLNNTITDAVNSVALNNPQTVSFSVPLGATPDETPPAVNTGTGSPADSATGIALTPGTVSVNFTEAGELDPTTINASTFYLFDGTNNVAATYSYTAATNTATLTPAVDLIANTNYTVTITTGIKDLSGNALAAGDTWGFQTTTALTDPEPGAPAISDSHEVTTATTTTATIRWTTDENTNYTLNYGRNTTTASSVSDLANYLSVHSVTLNPPLTAGQRYWANIDFSDYAGTAGTTSGTIQFNTMTPETPNDIQSGAGNQGTPLVLINSWNVASSGAFLFWDNDSTGVTHVYGQLHDSAIAKQWNAGSPLGLFTEGSQNYSYSSSTEDHLGGVIVMATRTTGGLTYAKRISAGGAFDWGHTAGGTGMEVHSAAISNVQAAPVYTGMLTEVQTGTIDRGSLTLTNPVYEDNDFDGGAPIQTLFDVVSDGDIIYDTTGNAGTTIDITGGDHEYIIGNDGGILAAGDVYIVPNQATTGSITVSSHTMNVAGAKSSATTTIYTQHGFSAPGTLSVGDIILNTNNSQYAQITNIESNPDSLFPLSFISGTESAIRTNHLIDGSVDFTGSGVSDWASTTPDLVEEATGASAYAIVSTVSTSDLTLFSDIFPLGTEDYNIYNHLTNGTSTAGTTTTVLEDTTKDFSAAGLGVSIGDIIVVTDGAGNISAIATVDTDPGAGPGVTTLSVGVVTFTAGGGESYRIYDVSSVVLTGTATSQRTDHLINGGETWSSAPDQVFVDDLVENQTGPTYALASVITDTDLTLDTDIFSGAALDSYRIYNEYCETHTTTPVSSYYRITIDHDISVADGHVLEIYDSETGYTGTIDSFPTNPLYEDDTDLSSLGLADGDIAFNATTGNFTTLDVSTYLEPYAVSLAANQFTADNETYYLYQFAYGNTSSTDIIDSGNADSNTLNHLTDAGHFGTVSAGDIAYNASTGDYAMVTAAAAGDLTLSWDAFPAGNEPYMIISQPGVLYVWEESGNIRGRIMSLEGSPPVELRSAFNIVTTASNANVVSDSRGNAVIIYSDGSSQIQAIKVNGYGTSIGTAAIDTQTAAAETIVDVISERSGSANDGIIVLYQKGEVYMFSASTGT